MVLSNVNFENILAGLLLRFGKASRLDVFVVADMMLDKGVATKPISRFATNFGEVSKYIMMFGDNYHLIDTPEIRELVEIRQGALVKDFLDTMDIDEFVLRKLSELKSVPDYVISTVFSEEQEMVLNNLEEQLLVIYVWGNDPDNSYQEIQLTSIGEDKLKSFKDIKKEDLKKSK